MLSPVRQRGMTLIEVMIAVTLAVILLALGMPSFFTGMQNRQIRTAADAIQNGLQVARNEALRRNRAVRFSLGTQSSWTVGCSTPDPAIVDGQETCPALIRTRSGQEGSANAQIQPLQMVAGSTIEAATPVFTGDITFTPLGRVINTPGVAGTLPAGNVAVYEISNPPAGSCAALGGEMRCLRVVVTAAGQVRMCDPAVTVATDPRKCLELS
jgi:type IV fimbrial biogenesis protein FimT